jgi:hypothetical protein
MSLIVTHPGSAHKDDFMAVSVLLATLADSIVERREATPEDLADPDTYVIDVGMHYEPERHNFDHHHDQALPCAFHLVMEYLGYHEAAKIVYGWYQHMSMMDVRGPHKTAEHLGVNTSVLFAASSPIDGYILSLFSRIERLTKGDSLYALMQDFGQDFIAMIDQKMARFERLKQEVQIHPVDRYKAIVNRIEDNPKLSLELYLNTLNDDQVVLCITPSMRGAGWELLRLGDNLQVDFRDIAANPEVRFVHVNGFVAKTRSLLPLDQVLELAGQAIRPVDRLVHQ